MAQQHKIGTVATSVFTEDGVTRVVYHQTPVVKFDGQTVTLNSGGWKTATTKTRMNQAARQFGLGFLVSQKDGDWYVSRGGETLAFSDGMQFSR